MLVALCAASLCFPASQAALAEVVRADLPDGGWTETEVRRESDGSAVPHGAFRRFGPGGSGKRIEGEHADGARVGNWRWRDAAGVLRIRGRYEAGRRDGRWTFRDASDAVRAEGIYRDGGKARDWTYADAEGNRLAAHCGAWEELLRRDAYDKPLYRGYLLDGVPHGRWTVWWATGAVFLVAELERGRPAGAWSVGHADGTPDPGFPAPRYGDAFAWHDADVEPPPEWLWGAPTADPGTSPPALDVGLDVGLGDLPRAAAAGPDDGELAHALDRVLGPEDPAAAQAAARTLVARPRESLPLAVNRLLALDLADAADVAAARRLEDLVLHPAIGCSFGLVGGVDEIARASNRLALLRWRTVARLVRDNAEFWGIEHGVATARSAAPPVAGSLAEAFAAEGLALGAPRPRRGPAVDRSLRDAARWLAASQDAVGAWSCTDLGDGPCASLGGPRFAVGTTGLALLALLGEGGNEHRDTVHRGLRWLLLVQREDGGFGPVVHERSTTEHAVATYALSEALQSSGSVLVHGAAAVAVRYLQRARNPGAGWRYDVRSLGDNDTVVTGWAMLALDAARRAGLEVEAEAFDGGRSWILEVTYDATGRIGYDAFESPPSRYKINEGFPRYAEGPTSIGLHATLRAFGRGAEDATRHRQLAMLLERPPEWDAEGLRVDLHHWFHATRAIRLAGHERARAWNAAVSRALLDSQIHGAAQEGSWDPVGAWGAFLGRQGTTALAMLALQSLAGE